MYTASSLPSGVRIQQHLDRADQLVQVRRVAELGDMRDHLGADAVQETQALVADGHRLDRRCPRPAARAAWRSPRAARWCSCRRTGPCRCVTTMKPTALASFACHERVRVLRIGLAEVGGDVAHLVAVGTGRRMRSCALRILEAATISIALVIFFVFSTDLILPRISLPAAMSPVLLVDARAANGVPSVA